VGALYRRTNHTGNTSTSQTSSTSTAVFHVVILLTTHIILGLYPKRRYQYPTVFRSLCLTLMADSEFRKTSTSVVAGVRRRRSLEFQTSSENMRPCEIQYRQVFVGQGGGVNSNVAVRPSCSIGFRFSDAGKSKIAK